MCGIAGKVSLSKRQVTEKEISQMIRVIVHRGPDDSGIYLDRNVGLGFRRLAIIDLSPLGHQPMSYKNRYQIVFNGEIYNFQKEKKDLETRGHKFKSKTDTEVILALYDEYREKCLDHLRGMFAFAIYDAKERTLFCARDRVGKKPFKYYHNKEVFLFASELKAILTQAEYRREPDYEAIHHYLTLQYVPAPQTGFVGINKLPPGHYLTLDIVTGKLEIKEYWRLDYSKKLHLSEMEWRERIMTTLEESVRLRMMADVPLGAFLSGGIDSSAVVGIMARNSSEAVRTFSIGFEEEEFSELEYARIVANLFKTDHTEFIVKPDTIEVLPLLVKHYEEPYADSSALPTYYISKMARDHVTVALNGDGGDENFAGYSRYSVQKFAMLYDNFLFFNNIVALPVAKALLATFRSTFFERVERFARTLSLSYPVRYLNYTCYFSNEAKRNLYTENFLQRVWRSDTFALFAEKFSQAQTPDKLDQTLYVDFTTYLPDDLLVKVDIATSAVSLEGRSPFLDHKMLEMTAQIPFNLKLKGLNNKKYILKKTLEGFIPNEVMYRTKRGFSAPIGNWFRGTLKNYTKEILLSARATDRGLFKREAVRQLLHSHESTNINLANQIWALLTLELWFREYFD